MKLDAKVLITGATGFIGRALCAEAIGRGLNIRTTIREECSALKGSSDEVVTGNLNAFTDWSSALAGCNVVIHLAARTHSMSDDQDESIADFQAVNVDATLALATQAAQSGVKRFLYISSVKVNGEKTPMGAAYGADDLPAPEDAYGASKAEAEACLRLLALETGMELTIIRPPLVYGPGVKGNFHTLLSWVLKGWPLPLGAVRNNHRSWVCVDNLVDLILVCIKHPNAANQTFLVSDNEDLSTHQLLCKLAEAFDRPVRLFSVPVCVLNFLARMLGKKAISQRLLGSLRVDIRKTCTLLDWRPPVTVHEGFRKLNSRGF